MPPVADSDVTPLSYRDAGVDIDAGEALVKRIAPLAQKTLREGVLAGIGGFGALFEVPKHYSEPVLVSGTDGVGTKLKLACLLNRHEGIGQDLVAMSVNDILAQGAEPLFFLDYFACGKLDVDTAAAVVQGMVRGCEQAGCALIGGETAEMPDMYPPGAYDLAGFALGVVEKTRIMDSRRIMPGDAVIGLASSGAHANGYSLIRKIIDRAQPDLKAPLATDSETSNKSLAEQLVEPTRIYVKSLLRLRELVDVKGVAHITGGGLVENLPRVLPDTLAATIDAATWKRPSLFDWLQHEGQVEDQVMWRVFNCGIGMTVVVSAPEAPKALKVLAEAGESAYLIGRINARTDEATQTRIIHS